MTADAMLARELTALRDELSASHREPSSRGIDPDTAGAKAAEPPQAGESGDERHFTEQLRDLVNTIKEFAEDAEQNMQEHPTATLVGALLLGILIGRLLGKR